MGGASSKEEKYFDVESGWRKNEYTNHNYSDSSYPNYYDSSVNGYEFITLMAQNHIPFKLKMIGSSSNKYMVKNRSQNALWWSDSINKDNRGVWFLEEVQNKGGQTLYVVKGSPITNDIQRGNVINTNRYINIWKNKYGKDYTIELHGPTNEYEGHGDYKFTFHPYKNLFRIYSGLPKPVCHGDSRMRFSCNDGNFTYFRFEIDPSIVDNVSSSVRKKLVKYEYFYDGGEDVVRRSQSYAEELCSENPRYRFCKETCSNTSISSNCRNASIKLAQDNNWSGSKSIKIYKENRHDSNVKASVQSVCNVKKPEEWPGTVCSVYAEDNRGWKSEKMWDFCKVNNNLLFTKDCKEYCERNPESCKSTLEETCNNFVPAFDNDNNMYIPNVQGRKLMKLTDNGMQFYDGNNISNNIVDMCGCFYNTRSGVSNNHEANEFYKNDLITTYKNNKNVINAFNQSGQPIKCFTKSCKDSSLRNVYGQCQGVTCIQNLQIKAADTQMTGTEINQVQRCGYDVEQQPPSGDVENWDFKFD